MLACLDLIDGINLDVIYFPTSELPKGISRPETEKPDRMKAIKTRGPGIPAEIQDVPIPALRDDYVLVRVKAVALNPTDW